MTDSAPVAVSIILPTYNRAAFLPGALASIRAQTFAAWELIVVDDGSTDGTGELVASRFREVRQPTRYVFQPNAGFYAARRAGVALARGKYLAFLDSDDLWLPHHLSAGVAALEANPDVDWVFAACRRADYLTGRLLQESTFYSDGRPWPFLRLRARAAGALRVLDDPDTTRCALSGGLNCGLQSSVVRRHVLCGKRFPVEERNVAVDQALVVHALKEGARFAYFDAVHAVYHVHDANASAPGAGTLAKRLRVAREEARCYERLAGQVRLTAREHRALGRRLGAIYFWHLGYALLWQNDRRDEALEMMRRGLRLWPRDWRCWKTYLLALCRSWLAAGRPASRRQLETTVQTRRLARHSPPAYPEAQEPRRNPRGPS